MTATLCAPDVFLRRQIDHCPTCKTRRRFAGRDQAWYGTTWTCCTCGDSWTDGEMHPRPFKRGWRQQAVERARRDWAAGTADRAAHRDWLRQQLRDDTRGGRVSTARRVAFRVIAAAMLAGTVAFVLAFAAGINLSHDVIAPVAGAIADFVR